MTLNTYLEIINKRFKTGISREHTYRGDLQTLLMTLLPDILVTNEPSRVHCGAPDYVLTKKDIPVGYIEAKDIGVDLHSKTLKEQFDRYRSGLSNLIFTDYLDFQFYKNGEFITSIQIAKIENGEVIAIVENFGTFESLIKNFALTVSQSIKSPTKLAEMMAGKAKLMADVIERSLNHDDETQTKSELKSQMLSFKQMLIHDITNSAFADIYAQTIAYGMFAARYHDPTLPTFSRQEAATLIPKSNPFLRKLFQDIAGFDLDDRLVWIVDELVNIFLATDVADIMKNFGKSTKQEDPVVHFYETFLASYNPALRKARGVWYTPQPVVNFIVRAVDDILKTEFDLPQGLADTSKIKIKKNVLRFDERSKTKSKVIGEQTIEEEVHKVQILDPATGTGTFLAEVVRHIFKKFESQQGIWSNYVSQHLIPRLNGFELLMASYAMAHLKMDMLLTETGYKATSDQRFRIFLTNSLEEAHPDTGTLFSSWLSDEADQANAVKRDKPVMVVIGNPPYSINSNNKSKWIENLISDYKVNLNERKVNLDDDYIKFIRFGQHFIDKNGEGILAYISNNSFLDGVTHRQMRIKLMDSFDKIYILNLHGNSRLKELTKDGLPDQNVFDIMQGVSINIFIKNQAEIKNDGKVLQFDLYGQRKFKYDFLVNNNINSINWQTLNPCLPYMFFVPKDFSLEDEYTQGLKISELLINNNTGIQTKCDELSIHFKQDDLTRVISDFQTLPIDILKTKYPDKLDSSGWNFADASNDLKNNKVKYAKILYRPFDIRFTVYTGKSSGFIGRPRTSTMSHLVNRNNIGLITLRINGEGEEFVCLVSNLIIEKGSLPRGNYSIFPLYLYPEQSNQPTLDGVKQERYPNLNMEIVNKIAESAGLHFAAEENLEGATVKTNQFHPIDILDYIYAVLHSPAYRQKYKEFLKIDFPRVPYPTHLREFYDLVNLGSQLRKIHLLESEETEKYITQYPEDGNNEVVKPVYANGKVYINENQYFNNVSEVTWNFYIGGYQPAQKWLKDRKGRTLEFDDILHYQKIIVALIRTAEIMIEIDKVMAI